MRKATYNCAVGKINAGGGEPVNRHMINPRLFDHYGIDTTKDLKIRTRCGRPWDTLLIDRNGSCYACECTAWLPQSIGNIQIQSLADIINNSTHQHIQSTIADGTYRLCNSDQCSAIKNQMISPEGRVFVIRLAIDDSCNLACPSCRTQRRFVSRGPVLQRKRQWVDKIVQWIQQQSRGTRVVIGSDGDPFASLVYRYFMQQAHKHKWRQVEYDFQTNGLLIHKMYQRFGWVFDHTRLLNISIDGATPATYEQLRLGGSFDKLIHNFEFLKQQQRGYKIYLHMVVQKQNWHEMKEMLAICERYRFDGVFFNLIQDWNTGQDIKEQTAFTKTDEFKHTVAELKKNPLARIYQLS